jgi:hypothetical protein
MISLIRTMQGSGIWHAYGSGNDCGESGGAVQEVGSPAAVRYIGQMNPKGYQSQELHQSPFSYRLSRCKSTSYNSLINYVTDSIHHATALSLLFQ